jgi:hypothetical protein
MLHIQDVGSVFLKDLLSLFRLWVLLSQEGRRFGEA